MTPSGIEPATFRLVAQYLKQQRHCVPLDTKAYNLIASLVMFRCFSVIVREVHDTKLATLAQDTAQPTRTNTCVYQMYVKSTIFMENLFQYPTRLSFFEYRERQNHHPLSNLRISLFNYFFQNSFVYKIPNKL